MLCAFICFLKIWIDLLLLTVGFGEVISVARLSSMKFGLILWKNDIIFDKINKLY